MIVDYLRCIIGIIKFYIYKILYFKRVKNSSIPKIDKDFIFAIKKESILKIGKNFRARKNLNIRIYNKGKVSIGNNCFFNDNCSISCLSNITIGDNFKAGPNTMIIDNDHEYKQNIDNYICSDIIIGKNVWIGANCIILKGVKIGDNVVIAAGTIVRENIENNILNYDKRINEKRKIKYD